MKSVAHFMSGGRLGGRYLLAVAKGEMQAGAVMFVASWEIFAQSGFVPTWWGWISAPVIVVVAAFGFVIYRFRQTQAMTLAQFFEMRYSRNFRLFTGVLGFTAGIINFGIIPAVGARFIVYYLQWPDIVVWGSFSVQTYILVMAVLLSITVTLTLVGGLVTLMVTDCLEGIFSQIAYVILIIGVFFVVSWDQMAVVLSDRPPNHSIVNPFDAWAVEDFNFWYVLMALFLTVYGTMAWQNSSAYNAAGASPHEAVMGNLLGRWREMSKSVVVVLLGAAAMTYLYNPDFATSSELAKTSLQGIEHEQIQKQMAIPVALSHLLPIGLKGLLCAVLIMGIFGGDSTHLHSWGGILAQDVILPRLRRAPTPRQHIWLIRSCICGVALFAFIFGALFQQTEYIVMWWSVTMAIYVGGAGSAIIGGLYWRKGTTAGAWTSIVAGAILSGGGILCQKIWGGEIFSQGLNSVLRLFSVSSFFEFKLNGIQISFGATFLCIGLYVLVSLCTWRKDFPLNEMLHRGEGVKTEKWWRMLHWRRMFGITSDFSRGDRWMTVAIFSWSLLWFVVLIIGCLWQWVGSAGWIPWIVPWSDEAWLGFWHVTAIALPIVMSAITAVWFTWGGFRDIVQLFRRLKSYKIDNSDNGRVKQGAHSISPHHTVE